MDSVTFELEPCPHCGSDAQIRDHAVYRYQCMACGNPRLPVDGRWLRTPPHVTRHLAAVRRHHIQKGLWKAGSWVAWIAALLTALLGAGTAWSLDFAAAGWTFVTVLFALPLLVGVGARLTGNKHGRQVAEELEQAWRNLASFFFTSSSTPRTLADVQAAFGVDTDSALKLLAEGEVASYLAQGDLPDATEWRSETSPTAGGRDRFRVEADEAGAEDETNAALDDASDGSSVNPRTEATARRRDGA